MQISDLFLKFAADLVVRLYYTLVDCLSYLLYDFKCLFFGLAEKGERFDIGCRINEIRELLSEKGVIEHRLYKSLGNLRPVCSCGNHNIYLKRSLID